MIERTFDYALIRSIMTDPTVWCGISDDYAGSVHDFKPIESEQLIYALWSEAGIPKGLWLFVPQSRIRWEVHTCIPKESRGRAAFDAAQECMQWVWQNTECVRIITAVPAFNPSALRFARMVGMQVIGVDEKSFQKGGELHDQMLLGISKP
jgi:RimJ/RimL family protein N-acetyltransferase